MNSTSHLIASTSQIQDPDLWRQELEVMPGAIEAYSKDASVLLLTRDADGTYIIKVGTQRGETIDSIKWDGGQHTFGSGVPRSRVESIFNAQKASLTTEDQAEQEEAVEVRL